MAPLRFAVFGTGFWARYQLAAWGEVGGAECVALYNRTRSKAEALAEEFGVPAVYDDAETLLQNETLNFADIITDVETHARFVGLCARFRVPVICQKPMAPDLDAARAMVAACRDAEVPFFIHENWRWQTPLRAVKEALRSGVIGRPFRARLRMVSGFPVFANQPFLAELERFILTDMGSHILDVARFLFGEATSLYCQTQRVHPTIKGEDVATVMLRMNDGMTVLVEIGYPGAPAEHDRFPETYVTVEGAGGTVELGPDFWLRITTTDGTHARRVPPERYAWADPAYDVVHASIVGCCANLLGALRSDKSDEGEGAAETTGEDNLRTAELVFAAYDSAERGAVIRFPSPPPASGGETR